MGKPYLSKTMSKHEQFESLDKNQSVPSLNIDTKRNWINEYNWKVIEVTLSEANKIDGSSWSRPYQNPSKFLKHSSTSKCLNNSVGVKQKNSIMSRNEHNGILNRNENSIRNKLSFITKSWNQTRSNLKDTNKKLNEAISFQKQPIKAKVKVQPFLNRSHENKTGRVKVQQEISSDSDESISAPNSNIGTSTKQKPYTSFIDWANKRKDNKPADTNKGKRVIQKESHWVSPVSGYISKRNTQTNTDQISRNLIPIFSSNVKTIESKCQAFNLTLGQGDNTSSKENNAFFTTEKKEVNHLGKFNKLVTKKALEVNQSASIAYELSTGLQSVTKTLLESQQKSSSDRWEFTCTDGYQRQIRKQNEDLWSTQKYRMMKINTDNRSSKANSPQNRTSNELLAQKTSKGYNPVWESREVRIDGNYSTLRAPGFNSSNTRVKEWSSDAKDFVLL